jgi:glycosyltransferase involved in cell wall biosynthesis
MFHKMQITLGILAYNEAGNIEKTLRSLFLQSCFVEKNTIESNFDWHVLIVPNGCSDNTAAISESILKDIQAKSSVKFTYSVQSIQKPGKSNAWNHLIHDFAKEDTDIFVLMDADIEFSNLDTILNCLKTFESNASAQVVVDTPIKQFDSNKNWSLIKQISSKSSDVYNEGAVGICGQFYCARSAALKDIYMPNGLSVEDGFLLAMVLTDSFRREADLSRVVCAKNASHYYEGLTKISDIVKHEVRIVIGTALNCFLCWDSLMFLTDKNGGGAGKLISELNQKTPNWYQNFMQNAIANKGLWALPRGMLFRRFSHLSGLPILKKILRLPIACVAFCFDLIVFMIANKKLKNGSSIGYW